LRKRINVRKISTIRYRTRTFLEEVAEIENLLRERELKALEKESVGHYKKVAETAMPNRWRTLESLKSLPLPRYLIEEFGKLEPNILIKPIKNKECLVIVSKEHKWFEERNVIVKRLGSATLPFQEIQLKKGSFLRKNGKNPKNDYIWAFLKTGELLLFIDDGDRGSFFVCDEKFHWEISDGLYRIVDVDEEKTIHVLQEQKHPQHLICLRHVQ